MDKSLWKGLMNKKSWILSTKTGAEVSQDNSRSRCVIPGLPFHSGEAHKPSCRALSCGIFKSPDEQSISSSWVIQEPGTVEEYMWEPWLQPNPAGLVFVVAGSTGLSLAWSSVWVQTFRMNRSDCLKHWVRILAELCRKPAPACREISLEQMSPLLSAHQHDWKCSP